MLGYPPTPPPPMGSPVADRPTRRPPSFGSTKGAGRGPPPYSPQNCLTPLGITHWLAAAPVVGSTPPPSVHSPWATPRLWLWPRPCPWACPGARSCGPRLSPAMPQRAVPPQPMWGRGSGGRCGSAGPLPTDGQSSALESLEAAKTADTLSPNEKWCALRIAGGSSEAGHPPALLLDVRSAHRHAPPPLLARSYTDLGRPSAVTPSAKSLCGGVPSNAWHCGSIWDPLLVVRDGGHSGWGRGTGRFSRDSGGVLCLPSE